jgi:CRISPR/Cas system-associated endonuclease Cas3-HD
MYPKKVIQDTAKVLQSYLTYQAVRTILEQLSETNPTQAIWLSQYSDRHRVQDSDDYLSGLMTENKELLLRILTVRQDLAGSILEFLPEMVSTDIDKSNMEYRRQLLERLTQSGAIDSNRSTENVDTDIDRPS